MSYNLKYCSFIRIILMRLPCSVCFDEIRFLGDYYPKKLENDNRDLDRLYYGF